MKKRYLAVIFSILSPGLGHFYVGHFRKAFLLAPAFYIHLLLFFWVFQDYLSSIIILLSYVIIIAIWLYGVFDVLYLFTRNNINISKYNQWYYVLGFIFFLLLLNALYAAFSPIKTFTLPTKSMQNTIMKNDKFIVNKTSLIDRGDVVAFRVPYHPNTHYLKRCVAIGGDELIYIDKMLLIHYNEGDAYILENYSKNNIMKINGKLWVVNPHMITNSNIHYLEKNETNDSSFYFLVKYAQNDRAAMKAVSFDELKTNGFQINGKTYNAFYLKITKDHYFMMGDNRDHSNDSRFWGTVPQENIIGIAKVVYMNHGDFSRMGVQIK